MNVDDRQGTSDREQVEQEAEPMETYHRPGGDGRSVLQRIWKYRLHYLIVVPALLLIAAFKFFPLLETVYASFVDFKIFRGLTQSDWVGLSNYRHVFHNPAFHPVIVNTLIIKLLYAACCGILALIAALALSAIGSAKLRGAFATLFLLPYFIPSVIVAYMAMLALSPGHSPFGVHSPAWVRPEWFKTLFVLVEIFATFGIPALIAVSAIGARRAAMEKGTFPYRNTYFRLNVVPAMKAVAAFAIMQVSSVLSVNFELMHKLVNPLVFETGDTIEMYQFRSAFMMMDVNAATPIAVLQFIVQFACSLLAYYIIRGAFARELFTAHGDGIPLITGKGKSAAGIVVSLLFALVVLSALYLLLIYPFTGSHAGPGLSTLISDSHYGLYLIVYLAASAVFMLITLTLSFPLTVKDLPGRGIYKWFLIAVMSVGGTSFFEYLLIRDLGMVNTVFALYVTGFFSILPVFVLKSIYDSKHADLRQRFEGRGETYMFFQVYVPKVWKALLALGAMQFVLLWNASVAPTIYLSRPDLFPPVLRFWAAQSQMQAESGGLAYEPAVLLQFGALIALPSLLVLLLMRKWLTAEVLAGQVRNL